MPLYAYNLTGTSLATAAGNPAPELPPSLSPPSRGEAFDVTSELRPDVTVDPAMGVVGGLDASDFAALQAQVDAADVAFEWTSDPEYLTGALVVGGPTADARIDELERTSREGIAATAKAASDAVAALSARVDQNLGAIPDQAALLAALGDSIKMTIVGGLGEDITAAELNAGAAGTVKRSFDVELRSDSGSLLHDWANPTPVVTLAENVTDVDVGDPTPDAAPFFSGGKMTVRITFDTDAGATKTYVATETLTATVDISGVPVFANVSNVVRTYTVT